ncbi:MAG TPA: membrane protein insertase YidC [bacterium]|jgi:YidC/Oxa1 family membrane protein insertase
MFDRRTLIAFAVVALILILLPKYMQWVNPPRPVPVTTEAPKTPPADTTTTAAAPSAPVKAPADTVATTMQPKTEPGVISPDTAQPVPGYVTVETPLFDMAIGSNAQVTRYNLKKYHVTTGQPVALHQPPTQVSPAIGAVDFDFGDANPHTLKNLRFKASKTTLNIGEGGADSVVFTAGDSVGQQIRLTYIIRGDKYGFDLALRTEKLAVPETGEFHVLWKGGVPVTEPDPARDIQYAGAYAKVGDEVVTVKAGKDPKKEFTQTGSTGFVAVRSKYFIAAVIPNLPAAGTEIVGRNAAPKDKTSLPSYDATLRETWGKNALGYWTVYWGPMKYENLKALNAGVEETMNWGWAIIKPISRLILKALVGLHSVISNYGIVIIIFAIFIKLLLWPLTRKSQISMKKMSALQPEIQELRETHKNNPQAMNAAIMRLYKERGINPASGCLMLLPQMPVLYALYAIFSSTIEFRQAPFFGWIKDLAQPDIVAQLPFSIPLYGAHVTILPLIMGVTQFFMAKRTATDPNQKAMIYLMPVMMMLIFNNLPSGLTLYYTLFNLLAIVEQNFIKVPDFTPSVQVIEEKSQKAKKPKSQN